MSPCTEHPGLLCVIYCTFAMLRLASKDSNMLLAFCPSCLQNDLRLRLAISYDGFRNYPKSYTVSTRPPLQKHHGSLLGFSILYFVNFLTTSFPAIRCWEVANCHWIYHQICQDWGPITNMKLLMVAFPCFSWTSNHQYISYVCFPHKSALSG